jgi:oligoendopeptidase F
MLRGALLADERTPPETRLATLAAQLDAAVNFLLRIPRDYEFEREFYRERADGNLTASRIRSLMRECYARWFGDVFVGDDQDEMGWAMTPFLFFPRTSFYNVSYAISFVIASRIIRNFDENGPAYAEPYIRYLRATGPLDAETAVASALGFDLSSNEFWRESLTTIEAQIDEVERLVAL